VFLPHRVYLKQAIMHEVVLTHVCQPTASRFAMGDEVSRFGLSDLPRRRTDFRVAHADFPRTLKKVSLFLNSLEAPFETWS
jgi:Uri superfamily endonuclease